MLEGLLYPMCCFAFFIGTLDVLIRHSEDSLIQGYVDMHEGCGKRALILFENMMRYTSDME